MPHPLWASISGTKIPSSRSALQIIGGYMLRLAAAVGAILLAVTFAQAQTGKHSFSGMCAYYPGRGGGLTAAHKTLPFGTRVRVTDSKTGRSVIVVINDRGPFNKGRVLDLSTSAAKALGMTERGVVLVRADVL